MFEDFTLEGDIKFFYNGLATGALGPADIAVSGYNLIRDPAFETSVLISLFTDGKASEDDKVPHESDTLRGWWGDELLDYPIGSKLWLLGRSNITDETLTLAEQYIKDALAYKIIVGEADEIRAVAVKGDTNQINFRVSIIKKGLDISFKFFLNWKYQIFGGLN